MNILSYQHMQESILNIMTAGHVDHGKTSLVQALTGKWSSEHSEELKRGITIRLGYATCVIRKCDSCEGFEAYKTAKKCLTHNKDTKEVNTFSFIDAPGHETLMATMLSGAAIVDGALFVIAANEGIQPQTREHLMALQICGVKNIIIVQNKIDLVDEKQAEKNYNDIKEFVKGTVAENAPIIPLSAQHNANVDLLLETMNEKFKPVERDVKSPAVFLVLRSFDVNKPGEDARKLKGGVFGGILKRGTMKKGDIVQILPGVKKSKENKDVWESIETKIVKVVVNEEESSEIIPGGSSGIMTELDPFLTKADALAGSVVTIKGNEVPVWNDIKLKVKLLERIVGTVSEKANEPLKIGESLMINAWTAKTVGIVRKIKDSTAELNLRIPVAIYTGERVAISRLFEGRWRLVGLAEVT